MTTYIVYADPSDGHLLSKSTTYSTARSGSGITMDNTGTYVKSGQNRDNWANTGNYWIYESFFSFNTSSIPTTEEIVDAQLRMKAGWTNTQQVNSWRQLFYSSSWTAPLTTAQWVNPASLSSTGYVASIDILQASTPFINRYTGSDSLINTIVKGGTTKLMAISDRTVGGYANTGPEEIWTNSGDTADKPALYVYTTALTTMNVVAFASESLSDGTTISLRSNGASNPTITIGYTPLSGTGAWTQIGTLDPAFNKTVDGWNSISLTSDPNGNFFIIGAAASNGGTIAAQAFVRNSATSWTAKPVMTRQLPSGNGQSIRSVSSVYIKGGTDPNDLPVIWSIVARGAGGTFAGAKASYVAGCGWAQEAVFDPALLTGATASGTVSGGSTAFYSPHTSVGITPGLVEAVALDSNTVAVYVSRDNLSGTTVGGISTLREYQRQGFTMYNDSAYEPTGYSELVAIDAQTFAHVFDANGQSMVVRFYNTQCQRLGETSLPYTSFNGSVIGDKFTAEYDAVAGLVRVYYMNTGNSMSRFDVSPKTFTGTNVANVTTSFGAAGSTSTSLRSPMNGVVDERKVQIEGANNSSGTLSTVVFGSTAGNVVPAAPVLTQHANFDATIATQFLWKFSDANPKDVQTAYQIEFSRVSDSVVVLDSGKVTSTLSSYTLAASALSNGTDYRWRVRTYDQIDSVGAWSGYSNFTASATGTVNITDPDVDDKATIDTSSYNVKWTYTQSGGATQASRQVKVTRMSDSVVVLDTGMQATTATNYTVSGLASGVRYKVEVAVTNSASVVTGFVARYITPNYSEPMTPNMIMTVLPDCIQIQVVNPTPSGNRPEIQYNDIYRRHSGVVGSQWVRVAVVDRNAIYKDYAVRSNTAYDYQVTSRTS